MKHALTHIFKTRAGFGLFAIAFALSVQTFAKQTTPSWTDLARKVGESEEGRANVIAQLKEIPQLKTKLEKAIYTKNRPLALDVISSLELKEMVPDLLLHVPADPDGFLTVAVNSLMNEKNQSQILNFYVENLNATATEVSSAAVVAMLEPLGRLGVTLPRASLERLRDQRSPEVRSSLIYYLRMLALRHHKFENVDLLKHFLKAHEFQIRLQAVSVASEILSADAKAKVTARSDLKAVCESEKTSSIKSACYSFIAGAPRDPASIKQHEPVMCSTMEDALYSKDTIKVRMVFGYKDARPARFVGDRHERLAFIERITATCSGEGDVCGFVRAKDNADLFLKKEMIRGRSRRVLLWVINSSVGTDDQENRDDPFQKWKSKYAEEAFTTGLQDADVVLYDGHSRFGGGPDFTSPRLTEDGSVDPSHYQSAKPGLTKMIAALKGPPKSSKSFARLKMLGLFSCSSSQHFNDDIHVVSKAGVVSSKVLMYYSDALEQSLGTLSDVLGGRCPRSISFSASL